MIQLESKDYYKVTNSLSTVNINTMFAEAVIRQVNPGKVYVDCIHNPHTFYVAHPYGMSLLFGESDNEVFNHELYNYITNLNKTRHHQEWLQVDPANEWVEIIDSMLSSHNNSVDNNVDLAHVNDKRAIIRNTRVNFSFNRETFLNNKAMSHSCDLEVVQMTKELFEAQTGSVNPKGFWRDAEHFLTAGIGYSMVCDGVIASTAFSAFRDDQQLEIGIETSEAFRGKGYAYSVSSALIDYCLNHRLEPVWACRLDNEGSYKLAHKLGFEASITIPYYRLVV